MGPVLLIGYGNPGRADDGLGPALAQAIEGLQLPGVSTDSDYQLTVEDSVEIGRHPTVIFADADAVGPEPFSFGRLQPRSSLGFSSHGVEPEELLALANSLFPGERQAYLLGIRGYDFSPFTLELTERGRANLVLATEFLVDALRAGDLDAAADSLPPAVDPDPADDEAPPGQEHHTGGIP